MMNDELDVLLLAAGFGTRLRPLTQQVPKALLPICGTPIVDLQLDRLSSARRIVVNGHHLADALRVHLDARPDRERLAFSHEPEILGTGGAIAHARDLLYSDPVLVQNVDALCAVPFQALVAFHRAHDFAATMLLTRSELWPNVTADGDRVTSITPGRRVPGALTFTGCLLISRELIRTLPRGVFHDIRDTYLALIPQGRLGAFVWPTTGPGTLVDIGTPAAYLDVHRGCRDQAGVSGFGHVDPTALVGHGCRIAESVVLAGAVLAPGTRLRRAIIGPGAQAEGYIEHRMVTTLGEAVIEERGRRAIKEREARNEHDERREHNEHAEDSQ
jgi:mannose-1-phosphate guanylyltransferase